MNIEILPVKGRAVWPIFAPHHYLTAKYVGHRAWIAVFADEGEPVALASVIYFPHAQIGRAWREHRTVVLPDFQGLGLGARLGDWVAEHMTRVNDSGSRYFSRTVHPRLGAYREASPLWKGTSENRKKLRPSARNSTTTGSGLGAQSRVSFSHEYVGSPA